MNYRYFLKISYPYVYAFFQLGTEMYIEIQKSLLNVSVLPSRLFLIVQDSILKYHSWPFISLNSIYSSLIKPLQEVPNYLNHKKWNYFDLKANDYVINSTAVSKQVGGHQQFNYNQLFNPRTSWPIVGPGLWFCCSSRDSPASGNVSPCCQATRKQKGCR